MLSKEEVKKQSLRAYNTWKHLWRKNSKVVKDLPKLPMAMFRNQGVGKKIVLVSMGGSFERQVEILKQYQDKVDIMCCDKALVPLINHGIRPDYCLIADAQVSYEIYCEPVLEHTKSIVLVSNVNANTKWGINWKGDKTYYINKDNLESEKEFKNISGVEDMIFAGSNVSNAALIYASMVLTYDKYILLGYDFTWEIGGKFYSFANGTEKQGMKSISLNQLRVLDRDLKLVNCSENLFFSARWLDEWIMKMGGDCLNASDGILETPRVINFDKYLSNIKHYKRQLTDKELGLIAKRTLPINSSDTFGQAKQLMEDPNAIIISGQIEFLLKEDENLINAVVGKYDHLKPQPKLEPNTKLL